MSSSSTIIIGAGAAGLITAKTFIDDGFTNITILTEDSTIGGVWASHSIYPGLKLNNVNGEYRFSSLPTKPASADPKADPRLTGEEMRDYFLEFTHRFIPDKMIQYHSRVENIARSAHGWTLRVRRLSTNREEIIQCDKIVLCTGGNNRPYIPSDLSSTLPNFKGIVSHAKDFGSKAEEVLKAIPQGSSGTVVIVGGGKSAQDIATFFSLRGRRVKMIFGKANAFLAVPKPLPDFIRKSRLLSVMSPHIELNTRLERFLHQTSLGSWLVHSYFNFLTKSSFKACGVPEYSPLRNAYSLFWGTKSNEEGVASSTGFHGQVKEGSIELVSPYRVASFDADGCSVVLNSGEKIVADAIFLATGYQETWTEIFDEKTYHALGLGRHEPSHVSTSDFKTLRNPPAWPGPTVIDKAGSLYRGIVPAQSINMRNFAINGAILTANRGYTNELAAHWISSYFLGDEFLKVPSSPDEAIMETDRVGAWIRRRYPGMLSLLNESDSGDLSFFNWPQTCDQLLDDMDLPSLRSGGNWFNWVFKVVSIDEIKTVGEERKAKRYTSRSK